MGQPIPTRRTHPHKPQFLGTPTTALSDDEEQPQEMSEEDRRNGRSYIAKSYVELRNPQGVWPSALVSCAVSHPQTNYWQKESLGCVLEALCPHLEVFCRICITAGQRIRETADIVCAMEGCGNKLSTLSQLLSDQHCWDLEEVGVGD